jgi:hypothetical protein
MTRTESDVCDEVGISFVQGQYGWSDLIIVAPKGSIVNCRISRVFTDDIAGLMSLAKALIDNQSETVDMMDEPGGHRISIRTDPQLHHIVTFEVGVFNSRGEVDATPLLSMRVKRKQMLTLLMTELWKLNLFHQEPSFQRRRQSFGQGEQLRQLNSMWDADPRIGPSILK